MARPNASATPYTDSSANGRDQSVEARTGERSSDRAGEIAAPGLSGAGGKLTPLMPQPGVLRPLAKALIELALAIVAEERQKKEEKAA